MGRAILLFSLIIILQGFAFAEEYNANVIELLGRFNSSPATACPGSDVVYNTAGSHGEANLELHPCIKNSAESAKSNDLFAASCTCPDPYLRLLPISKAVRDNEQKMRDWTEKSGQRLAKNPAIIKGFRASVNERCKNCSDKFAAPSTTGDLAHCLSDPYGIRAGVNFLQEQHFSESVVSSGLQQYGNWKTNSKEALDPGGGIRNSLDPTGTGTSLDPAIGQQQCEQMGQRIFSAAVYAENKLIEYRLNFLRTSGDTRAMPRGLESKKVEVPLDEYQAVETKNRELVDKMYPKQKLSKINERFKVLKKLTTQKLLARMTDYHCDELDERCRENIETTKKQISDLNNVNLVTPSSLSEFTELNGFFNRKDNTISLGAPFLDLYESNPGVVDHFLAHELGHAVESAVFTSNPSAKYSPIDKVEIEACLRESAQLRKTPRDQFSEGFADWFAAEVLLEKGKPKTAYLFDLGIDLCKGGYAENSQESEQDEHPTSPVRINNIIAAHPALRSILKMPVQAAPKYCQPSAKLPRAKPQAQGGI